MYQVLLELFGTLFICITVCPITFSFSPAYHLVLLYVTLVLLSMSMATSELKDVHVWLLLYCICCVSSLIHFNRKTICLNYVLKSLIYLIFIAGYPPCKFIRCTTISTFKYITKIQLIYFHHLIFYVVQD